MRSSRVCTASRTRATPSAEHLAVLRDYYTQQRAAYARQRQRRSRACSTSASCRADPALDRTALAALTNVAALVMNSPDAYTVR